MFAPPVTPLSASSTDFSVAIIGTMSSCTRRFRSSIATTFVGSAMATKSFPFKRAIGTSLFAFAISRGTSSITSSGTRTFSRFIGGVFRQRPIENAMSCSVTNCLSVKILSNRPPSCFWIATASSSWLGRSNPSSIRTSAMRSPNDLLLMTMSILHVVDLSLGPRFQPVNRLQVPDDRGRTRQVPRHRVIDRLFDRFAAAGVKRIAARHHDGAAHEIERDKQTPEREMIRQHRRDLPVEVVILERHVGEFRPVD